MIDLGVRGLGDRCAALALLGNKRRRMVVMRGRRIFARMAMTSAIIAPRSGRKTIASYISKTAPFS